MSTRARVMAGVMGLALVAGARGSIWVESSDAGALPSLDQMTIGVGSLDSIEGMLTDRSDVDMFRITITNTSLFTAMVTSTSQDTQLYLFTTDGHGVVMNDDDPTGGGSLQSRVDGAYVPSLGTYLLAITRYNRDPRDSNGRSLWRDTPYNTIRQPDGPGKNSVITSWSTTTAGTGGAYTIAMTGASFAVAPSPGSLALLGLGGMVILRRGRGGVV
ncbi:MAG: DVUA0089 family protein [Phycisphaerales bacterium]|nr:MAG: DVUA0089 family protein [Phycisphaerales bacterium]